MKKDNIAEIFMAIKDTLIESDLIPVQQLIYGIKEEVIAGADRLPSYEAVMELANFLEQPIEYFFINKKGFFSPICFFNGYVLCDIYSYDEEQLNSLRIKDRIQYQTKEITDQINKGHFDTALLYIDERARLMVFKNIMKIYNEPKFKNKLFNAFLFIYCKNEFGFKYYYEVLKELLPVNQPVILKNVRKEKNGYVTLFRGQNTLSTPLNETYSWTTNAAIALFFAHRFEGEGCVYTAKVHKSDIIAYMDDRGESEVLVDPSKVKDIEILKFKDMEELLDEMENKGLLDVYYKYQNRLDPELFFEPYGIHGMEHTQRVLFWSIFLAEKLNLSKDDKKLLYEASILHDIGRKNNGCCTVHGQNSFIKAKELDIIAITDKEEKEILKYIIDCHCIEDEYLKDALMEYNIEDKARAFKLLKCFKEADGLDRVRIADLNAKYLRFPEISVALMGAAQQLYRDGYSIIE